jgi:hypothetical protein
MTSSSGALLLCGFLPLLGVGCGASVVLEDDGAGGGSTSGGSTTSTAAAGPTGSSTSTGVDPGVVYAEDDSYLAVYCEGDGPALLVEVYPGDSDEVCPPVPGTDLVLLGIYPWDGLPGTYTVDGETVFAAVGNDSSESATGTFTITASQPWLPTEITFDLNPPHESYSGTVKLGMCSYADGTNPCLQ